MTVFILNTSDIQTKQLDTVLLLLEQYTRTIRILFLASTPPLFDDTLNACMIKFRFTDDINILDVCCSTAKVTFNRINVKSIHQSHPLASSSANISFRNNKQLRYFIAVCLFSMCCSFFVFILAYFLRICINKSAIRSYSCASMPLRIAIYI